MRDLILIHSDEDEIAALLALKREAELSQAQLDRLDFLLLKRGQAIDAHIQALHSVSQHQAAQDIAALRKLKGLTQQRLADLIGIHAIQLARYEKGSSQPTLDVIRKLALALHVSADELLFDNYHRGPDSDLRLQFEAISAFSPEDKLIVATLLDALILRHEARRWTSTNTSLSQHSTVINTSSPSSSKSSKSLKTSKSLNKTKTRTTSKSSKHHSSKKLI